jgi:hypothetical protein
MHLSDVKERMLFIRKLLCLYSDTLLCFLSSLIFFHLLFYPCSRLFIPATVCPILSLPAPHYSSPMHTIGENNSDADFDGEGEGENDDNLDSVSSAESAGLGVRMG